MLVFWRLGHKNVFWLIVLTATLSLLLSEWGWRSWPSANFYLAPTRAWELLVGSLCAFLLAGRGPWVNNLLSSLGLALIVFAIFRFDDQTPFPSLYTLVPVLGAALIVLFGGPSTWVAKVLSTPPFVGIGLISYSAYLWHQPLFAFARIRSVGEPEPALMLFLSVLALALAYFSWRYIERPFRKGERGILPRQRDIFRAASVAGAVFILIGTGSYAFRSQIRVIWQERNPEIAANLRLVERAQTLTGYGSLNDNYQYLSDCRFNTDRLSPGVEMKIKKCYDKFGAGYLILGDSHAIDLYGSIASRFDENFIIGFTQASCRPHAPLDYCQYEDVLKFLSSSPDKYFKKAYFMQAGFHLMLDEEGGKGTRGIFSRTKLSVDISPISPDRAHIDATANYLTEINAHVETVWVGPIIEPHIPDTYMLKVGCSGPYKLRGGQEHAFLEIDNFLKSYLDRNFDFEYKSGIELFKFTIESDFCHDGAFTFRDGDHLSEAGETLFGSRLPSDFLK